MPKPSKDSKPDERISASLDMQGHLPRLSGGYLCLDFINTVEPRIGKHPQDMLTGYADLVRWGQYVRMVSGEQADVLLEEAHRDQEKAAAIFSQGLALREALYRIFTSLIHHTAPAASDLQLLQAFMVETIVHGYLAATDHGLQWQWDTSARTLDQLLWPLTRSAMALLTSPDVARVKECPSAEGGCGWLFLDRSKNGSRRWCSDEECGSLVRMRRLYARRRASRNG